MFRSKVSTSWNGHTNCGGDRGSSGPNKQKWKRFRSTIRYIWVSLESKERNWLIRFTGAAIFPSHEVFEFFGSLVLDLQEMPLVEPANFFSRKCSPMALTVSFFKSPTFLGCTKVQFSLVHSRSLHVKSTHTNWAKPLGRCQQPSCHAF